MGVVVFSVMNVTHIYQNIGAGDCANDAEETVRPIGPTSACSFGFVD